MRTLGQARRLGRDRRGAAALEFALILPALALLTFGILQYGVYFGVAHAMQQLTNDAARVAVGGLTTAERTALVQEHFLKHGDDYGMLRKSAVDLAVADEGGQIVVRTSYDAAYLPIFAVEGLVPMPPSTIRHRAAVRIGGF
jgi:Flp pilus assembly protein TadG